MKTKNKKIFGLYKKDFSLNVQWKIAEPNEYKGLSLDDKKWLGKFNDEWLNGRVKANDPEAIHKDNVSSGEICNKGKDMTFYRSCKQNVNAQNVDVLAIKSCGKSNGVVTEFVDLDGEAHSYVDMVENPYKLSLEARDRILDLLHHGEFDGEMSKERLEAVMEFLNV